jgi:hypothetical protein
LYIWSMEEELNNPALEETAPEAVPSEPSIDLSAMADLDARIAGGYNPTDAEAEAYAEWVDAGMPQPEAAPAPAPAVTPESAPSVPVPQADPEAEAKAARLQQLEAMASGLPQVLLGLSQGDPAALAAFKQITGQDFGGGRAGSPAAEPAPATAAPTASGLDSFLLPDDVIQNSVDPQLGQAYNERIKALVGAFRGEIDSIKKRLSDEVAPVVNESRKAKEMSKIAEIRSRVIDDMQRVAEAHAEDYGLTGIPTRELIEAYFKDTANPDPRLAELLETTRLVADGRVNDLEDAHRLRFFDKYGEKLANAKIANMRSGNRNAGGAGGAGGAATPATNPGNSVTLEQIIAGEAIPSEWLDAEGMPKRDGVPPEIYEFLTTGKTR